MTKTMTIDYENFKQVTTAGHVIETIRAEILDLRVRMGNKPPTIPNWKGQVRMAHKIQALQGLLNTLILQEMKMDAWQEMKGSEKITGELYKQLSNGDLYEHDKALETQKFPRFCKGCEMVTADCVCVDLDEEFALCDRNRS